MCDLLPCIFIHSFSFSVSLSFIHSFTHPLRQSLDFICIFVQFSARFYVLLHLSTSSFSFSVLAKFCGCVGFCLDFVFVSTYFVFPAQGPLLGFSFRLWHSHSHFSPSSYVPFVPFCSTCRISFTFCLWPLGPRHPDTPTFRHSDTLAGAY